MLKHFFSTALHRNLIIIFVAFWSPFLATGATYVSHACPCPSLFDFILQCFLLFGRDSFGFMLTVLLSMRLGHLGGSLLG